MKRIEKHAKGKQALITGASSGIGYAYACILARAGCNLLLVSNEREKLEEISAELVTSYGIMAQAFYADLARQEAAKELYDHCLQAGIRVDILINNAGFFFFGEAVEADDKMAIRKMNLHMLTPSLLCGYFGKDMKSRRQGHILNMSSISAWMPYPGLAYYAATKRYVKNFSRSLRSDMLDYGVNVTCVCPGATATNLFDRDKVDYKKAMRYGIMAGPEKVAQKGLNGMFRKKATVIPGFINKTFVFLVSIAPHGVIMLLKRNTDIIPGEK